MVMFRVDLSIKIKGRFHNLCVPIAYGEEAIFMLILIHSVILRIFISSVMSFHKISHINAMRMHYEQYQESSVRFLFASLTCNVLASSVSFSASLDRSTISIASVFFADGFTMPFIYGDALN